MLNSESRLPVCDVHGKLLVTTLSPTRGEGGVVLSSLPLTYIYINYINYDSMCVCTVESNLLDSIP